MYVGNWQKEKIRKRKKNIRKVVSWIEKVEGKEYAIKARIVTVWDREMDGWMDG